MRLVFDEEDVMIEPYQAIGLVPTMWGIRRREDIFRNLEHLDHLMTASTWLGGLDLPVPSSRFRRVPRRASTTRSSTSITRRSRASAPSISPARRRTSSAGWLAS